MYQMALTWILMLQMWPSGAVKFIPVGSTPGGAPRMPFIGRMQLFLATGNRLRCEWTGVEIISLVLTCTTLVSVSMEVNGIYCNQKLGPQNAKILPPKQTLTFST